MTIQNNSDGGIPTDLIKGYMPNGHQPEVVPTPTSPTDSPQPGYGYQPPSGHDSGGNGSPPVEP